MTALIIADSHLFIKASYDIKEFCRSFFKRHNINYF